MNEIMYRSAMIAKIAPLARRMRYSDALGEDISMMIVRAIATTKSTSCTVIENLANLGHLPKLVKLRVLVAY